MIETSLGWNVKKCTALLLAVGGDQIVFNPRQLIHSLAVFLLSKSFVKTFWFTFYDCTHTFTPNNYGNLLRIACRSQRNYPEAKEALASQKLIFIMLTFAFTS